MKNNLINVIERYEPGIDFSKQRGSLVEIHISDIHFGVISAKVQYNILEEQFLNKISRIHFDILSIDGDLFDHKVQANSDATMYATMFVDKCINLCKINNATMVLLHGTASHDANQLKLFYHYLSDPTIDIRVIEKAGFEFIKGKRVLCLPEEYGKGKKYYEKLLYNSGLYDGVYMHGTIKGAIYGKDIEDLDSDREPTFDIESFTNCMGPIIAGHVHIPGCYQSHMYYNGSPIRWCFGEESKKGFIILLHNLDSHKYRLEYEEIKSFRYDTINLDHLLSDDPKNIIDYINNLKSQGIDHIRVQFTIDKEDILNIIKYYYQSDPNVKIQELYKETKMKNKIAEELSSRYSGYDYILDDNLSPYEKLSRYINQEKGYAYITTDELINIINEEY